MPKRGRYGILDRAKSQDTSLARFNHLNPRYGIVDRETGKTVDDAETQYEAKQARRNWNAGVYDEETMPDG